MTSFSSTNDGDMANNMDNNGRNTQTNMANNNSRNMSSNLNNDEIFSSPFWIEWDLHRHTAAQAALQDPQEPRLSYGYRARNDMPVQQAPQPQAQAAPELHNFRRPVRSRTIRSEHCTTSTPRRFWADAAYCAEHEEHSRAPESQRQEQEAAKTLTNFMQNEYREEAAFISAAMAQSPLAPSNSPVRQSVRPRAPPERPNGH